MNNIREIESITERELNCGIFGGISKGSWHEKYKESAWVFLGGFPTELSEGDIICVMSQWGELEDINLVRDKESNKSKGFAFIKYEDQRSTVLAVDNFNGITLLGRTLRCDHVDNYKLPKNIREKELEKLKKEGVDSIDIGPGHAYKYSELEGDYNIEKGINLWGETDDIKNEYENDKGKILTSGNDDERISHNRYTKKHKEKHKKSKSRTKSSKHKRRIKSDDSSEGSISENLPAHDSRTILFNDGPVASWRGKREPTISNDNLPLAKLVSKTTQEYKRDEMKSYGGFSRLR